MTLCTLFNVNYLEKGLAMYESLENVSKDFTLYILPMDDKCYEILSELNYPHITLIHLEDFEDEELLRVKPTRSFGEYCWTCSSSLIRFVLKTYNLEYCTYIDADLFFYSDPSIIIEEMKQKNASVQVIGHRFNRWLKKENERTVGKYCVEFDTFKNDEKGRSLLEKWRNQCLEYCKIDGDGIHWGDQKYQDPWVDENDFCIETENLGAGVAPWNIAQYELVSVNPQMILKTRDGIKVPLVFYHFENINYFDRNTIKLNVHISWGIDNNLTEQLYRPYLLCVEKYKTLLKERFGIEVLIKTHPGVAAKIEKNVSQLVRNLFSVKKWKIFFFLELPKKVYESKDIVKLY